MTAHRRNADGSRDRLGQCPDCNKSIVFDGSHTCSPPAMKGLGRRAVACRHWRWMEGMAATSGARAVARALWCEKDGTGMYVGDWPHDADAIPDLTDPATLGCLISLVEESYGFPVCAYNPRIARDHWLVESAHDNGELLASDNPCATRAEALVAALEAAP